MTEQEAWAVFQSAQNRITEALNRSYHEDVRFALVRVENQAVTS